jgi:hypothetical protein
MSGYENTPKRHVRSAQREIAILRLLYLDFAIRGVRLGPIHGSGRKGASGGVDGHCSRSFRRRERDQSTGRTVAHLNCSSTNHFLSLSEHLLAGPVCG